MLVNICDVSEAKINDNTGVQRNSSEKKLVAVAPSCCWRNAFMEFIHPYAFLTLFDRNIKHFIERWEKYQKANKSKNLLISSFSLKSLQMSFTRVRSRKQGCTWSDDTSPVENGHGINQGLLKFLD